MEAKHWPGPYEIASETLVYALNEQGVNAFSAFVQPGRGTTREQVVAVAKLFQVAPLMHEACHLVAGDDWQAVIDFGVRVGAKLDWHEATDAAAYEYFGDYESDARHTYPNRRKLVSAVMQAVLAKATGEQVAS